MADDMICVVAYCSCSLQVALERAYLRAQLARRQKLGKAAAKRSSYTVADFGCGDAVRTMHH